MPLKNAERPRQALILADLSGGLNIDAPLPLIPQNQGRSVGGYYVNKAFRKNPGARVIATPLGGPNDDCFGIFQFKKHETDGTITRQLLVLFSTSLYELTGAYPTHTFTGRGTMTGRKHATAAQLVNRMVISNGTAAPQVWDGTSMQNVEVPDPDAMTGNADANTGGALTIDGTYRIAYTMYSTTTTDESNPSPIIDHPFTLATPAGADSIQATVPANASVPARYDVIRLYRSRIDQQDLKFEKQEAIDPAVGGLATFGTKTDDQLGTSMLYNNDPMPTYQILWTYDGRVFGLGHPERPTELGWSKLTQPTIWDLEDSIELDSKDGFALTGMHDLGGRLVVFKKTKAYLVSPDPFSIYGNKPIPAPYGLLSHWGKCLAKNVLWGIGEGVFWRFDGAFFQDISKDRYSGLIYDVKGASNAAPVWVIADTAGDKNRLVVGLREPGQLDGLGTGGFISLGTMGFFHHQHLDRFLFLAERDDGTAYLLGSKKGNILELFEDDSQNVHDEFDGTGIDQSYRSGSIDPEMSIGHKMFERIDFLLGDPGGAIAAGDTYRWQVRYDDSDTVVGEFGDIGPFPDTGIPGVVEFPVRLDSRMATRVQVELYNTNANKKGFVLIAMRLVWRALGDMYDL